MSDDQNYHARVAVGHFARKLAAERKRGGYQATAVLFMLWSFAADPWRGSATVHVAFSQFAGIVPTQARLRQIVCELKSVGALVKVGRSLRGAEYLLKKPAISELDEIARGQYTLPPSEATPPKPDIQLPDFDKASEKKRTACLKTLGTKRSEIRNILAELAGLDRSELRYKTKGAAKAAEVEATIDWLRETGADMQTFLTVCKRVLKDPSKPADPQWIFAPKHSDYLAGIIARKSTRKSEETPAPTRQTIGDTRNSEQLMAWLTSFVSAEEAAALVADHGEELLALESEHFAARLQAWRDQEERGSLSDALLQVGEV